MKTPIKRQPDPKELMAKSEAKKKFAATQEKIGNAQIKNKVKEGSMGQYGKIDQMKQVPVGQQRLKIAKDMRLSAKLDSLQSVRIKNKQELDNKVKLAEKLYKSNPTKSFSNAVEIAKKKRAEANKIKPKK